MQGSAGFALSNAFIQPDLTAVRFCLILTELDEKYAYLIQVRLSLPTTLN
jgi:hypothetical protein